MTRPRKAPKITAKRELWIEAQGAPIPRTCSVCEIPKIFPMDFCQGKNHRMCLVCLKNYSKASREKRIEWYRERERKRAAEIRGNDTEAFNKYQREWKAVQYKTNTTYRLKHKTRSRAQESGYKELRHLCPPGFIDTMMDRQNGICASPVCDKNIRIRYHIDHIMPMALGGRSNPENLQLLCPRCNLTKHKKHPDDWLEALAAREGLLFI